MPQPPLTFLERLHGLIPPIPNAEEGQTAKYERQATDDECQSQSAHLNNLKMGRLADVWRAASRRTTSREKLRRGSLGTCRVADSLTRGASGPMFRLSPPSGNTRAMSKTCVSLLDLRRRALAEIRRLPGCHDVQKIAIHRVTNERADYNWSLCVLCSCTADANTAARAAVHVQSVLRRDYDLLLD